jgi:exodeoxyribonuclease VII small subunit
MENQNSFETVLSELERIVQQLEAGQLSLEDSLQLFGRGQQLLQTGNTLLEQASLRMQQILPAATGVQLVDFEVD